MLEKIGNVFVTLICILSAFFAILAWNFPAWGAEITTSSIKFTWSQVTTCGGEPCAVEGYALYRSRQPDQWRELNNLETAFVNVLDSGESKQAITVLCEEDGTWYWTLRAFNKTNGFSAPSNVQETIADFNVPASPALELQGFFTFGINVPDSN